jgi:predicted SAM-dependent methyltransferase
MKHDIYDPNNILEAYKNEENNDAWNIFKFNILQKLGSIKNKLFTQKDKCQGKEYLNLGAGSNLFNTYINLDVHNKKSLFSISKDEVFRHDLREKLKFKDNSFIGVYTEHCLEHLNPRESFNVLKECYRILKKGGILRIVVPDAEKYVNYYIAKKANADTTSFGQFNNWKLGAEALRGLTCYLGHYTLYDSELLSIYLKSIGFEKIKICKYRESYDENLVKDNPGREWNSLYIEAIK